MGILNFRQKAEKVIYRYGYKLEDTSYYKRHLLTTSSQDFKIQINI